MLRLHCWLDGCGDTKKATTGCQVGLRLMMAVGVSLLTVEVGALPTIDHDDQTREYEK